MAEGEFVYVQGDAVPQSADVVFIVEAKECNRNVRSTKKLDQVIEILEKELERVNLTYNRWISRRISRFRIRTSLFLFSDMRRWFSADRTNIAGLGALQ